MKTKGHPVVRSFAHAMRKRRLILNISQEDLAFDLNLHVNTLGNIERGLTNPNLTVVLKLSKRLGISLDYLLEHIVDDLDI